MSSAAVRFRLQFGSELASLSRHRSVRSGFVSIIRRIVSKSGPAMDRIRSATALPRSTGKAPNIRSDPLIYPAGPLRATMMTLVRRGVFVALLRFEKKTRTSGAYPKLLAHGYQLSVPLPTHPLPTTRIAVAERTAFSSSLHGMCPSAAPRGKARSRTQLYADSRVSRRRCRYRVSGRGCRVGHGGPLLRLILPV